MRFYVTPMVRLIKRKNCHTIEKYNKLIQRKYFAQFLWNNLTVTYVIS
jgi:hypothetical protein